MRIGFGLIIAAVVVVGCAISPPAQYSSPLSSAADPSSTTPSAAATASGGTTTPAGEASVEPSPTFTHAELELMFGLRQDVQERCVPRQTDLPPGALAGVECDLGDGLAARVGAFRFATERDAFQAYAARLTTYRVPLRSGDCWAGTPGDSSWIPGDGPGEGGDSVNRSGCYLDENGLANIRLTCPLMSSVAESGTYVGVLGTNADVAALFDWTWRYPEGVPMETPSPPGICYNDSIPFPDS